MFEKLTDQGIRTFRFETLPRDLEHGVISRQGGIGRPPFESLNLSSSVPDDEAAYTENRRRAYAAFGRTVDTLVHAHLIHENHVARVAKNNHGEVIPYVEDRKSVG